jgi:tetratricopeptide (TPR) repeat protein
LGSITELGLYSSKLEEGNLSNLKELFKADRKRAIKYMAGKIASLQGSNKLNRLMDLRKIWEGQKALSLTEKEVCIIEDTLIENNTIDFKESKIEHDIKSKCSGCETVAKFTVKDQKVFKEKEWNMPRRCLRCRVIKKTQDIANESELGTIEVLLKEYISSKEYDDMRDMKLKYSLGVAYYWNDRSDKAIKIFQEVKKISRDKDLAKKCDEYLEDMREVSNTQD